MTEESVSGNWLDEPLNVSGHGENGFLFVPASPIPVIIRMTDGEPDFIVQKGASLEALEQLRQWFHYHGMLVEEDYRANCTKDDPGFRQLLEHLNAMPNDPKPQTPPPGPGPDFPEPEPHPKTGGPN